MFSSVPDTMKAVVMEASGGAEVLEYRTGHPVPVPKDGEVFIKNDFIGINFFDVLSRSGRYPVPTPHILGVEAEGTIVAVASTGDLHGLKPGDRVAWIGQHAYAEYSTCSASKVYVLPPKLEPGVAAASLSQGLTALAFIEKCYHVQKGDWILVQGAAGGVGLWFCQLLAAVGARVIGTATNLEKMKLASEHGAEFMLNYSEEDVGARVKEITKGAGVAAVFDSVGAATLDASLEALALEGTMISVGATSGALPPFAVTLLTPKNLRLMKPSLFGYIGTRDEFVTYSEKLFGIIGKQGCKAVVHKVYPLAETAKAHADLEGRKTSGKLLLKV